MRQSTGNPFLNLSISSALIPLNSAFVGPNPCLILRIAQTVQASDRTNMVIDGKTTNPDRPTMLDTVVTRGRGKGKANLRVERG